jgi:molybdopterin/thiamine biosynthesis adenylyltransferase
MNKTPHFTITLPAGMHDAIREFLFRDPSREYMGVILAGINETDGEVKLLGRKFIPVDASEYEYQSVAGLTVRRQFSQRLMQQCAKEGLSQIDVHSHPFGASPDLWFSGTDDRHERIMASYIYNHLPESLYASIVMNQGYTRARVWLPDGTAVQPHTVQTLNLVESPLRKIGIASCEPRRDSSDDNVPPNPCGVAMRELYARQIVAFGAEGQAKMAEMNVTVVGAGGIGSLMIEGLVRLGVHQITVIDPDTAEVSNLNRVAGMTYADAISGVQKVSIACRSVDAIHPKARASPICRSVLDPECVPVLKASDLIVVATDNHATRMYAQRLGVQYLIPVVSVGVNIEVDETGKLDDVSGEYAIALPGESGWCLTCAHAYNPEIAAWELADAVEQQRWVHRGYVAGADIKSPSVSHLNGVVANLALAEIHNLLAPFKAFQGYCVYDQRRSELMSYTIQRNKECAMCSDAALLGLGDIEPVPDYRSLQQRLAKVPVA